MVYKHLMGSNLSQFVWEKSIFWHLWKIPKKHHQILDFASPTSRSSAATFGENGRTRSRRAMQTPTTTSGRSSGTCLASSRGKLWSALRLNVHNTSFGGESPPAQTAHVGLSWAWWPPKTFSHRHQIFILMPMGVNGIQTPSGEQPEHLENVICADMKVLGAIVVKNDQKATSLYYFFRSGSMRTHFLQ